MGEGIPLELGPRWVRALKILVPTSVILSVLSLILTFIVLWARGVPELNQRVKDLTEGQENVPATIITVDAAQCTCGSLSVKLPSRPWVVPGASPPAASSTTS